MLSDDSPRKVPTSMNNNPNPDDNRKVPTSSAPYDRAIKMSIHLNQLSPEEIIGEISDGQLTKKIVEQLKQERDKDGLKEGSSKRFFKNFNALVNMLHQESENNPVERGMLESVGFLPDSSIKIIEDDDGLVLKGGIRRRKGSRKRKRSSRKRKGSRRKRSSRRK